MVFRMTARSSSRQLVAVSMRTDIIDITYSGPDGWPLFAALVDPYRRLPTANVVVLMHGGGPDHQSSIPLARQLCDRHAVLLPDVRGYGRSLCSEEAKHTWASYAADVIALLDHLKADSAIVGGAGLGATITLRTALAHRERVRAAILISVEDIEDDEAKVAETAFMREFAARVREEGLYAAWAPILPNLAPVIREMVHDAIPRSNAASIAAAAAIGDDRAFRSVSELAAIAMPTLIIPGMDERHPQALAEQLADLLPHGKLAAAAISDAIVTAEDFARCLAPAIREFLNELPPLPTASAGPD